jgi:hypothetical protein
MGTVIILLSVLLAMAIIVMAVKYWGIFKWILLVIAALAVWLGVSLGLAVIWVRSDPALNYWPGLLVLGWPLLLWLIPEWVKDAQKPGAYTSRILTKRFWIVIMAALIFMSVLVFIPLIFGR